MWRGMPGTVGGVSASVRRHTPVHPNALQEMVERFKHVSGFEDGATHWSVSSDEKPFSHEERVSQIGWGGQR